MNAASLAKVRCQEWQVRSSEKKRNKGADMKIGKWKQNAFSHIANFFVNV
jgi:hypothetical protein